MLALPENVLWTPARCAELLSVLPIAVFTIDKSGLITGYNARAAELWGREPVCGDMQYRFCGSHRLYHLDGTWVPHDQCPMARVLEDGVPVRDREILIERPDGSRITALVNIVPMRDETGATVGAMNCFADISPRKQAEDELLRKQHDLEDFFENGAVALHWVAADGTIVRANKAELDMLGYRAEEYVGRKISEFHADGPVIDQILTCLARGERLDKFPARLRAKNGSIRHVLITSNVQFRDGKFIHTRCFTIDVTEVHRAQEALRERERLLHELLEALPAAIYTTDARGRITYFNQAAVDFAGRRPVLGSDEWCVTWRMYRPDGTPLPHDQCPMAVALKENRAIRGVEAVAERPDGTRIPFIPYPTPLHDATGAVIGAVNMLIDASDIKRAEQTSQRLAAIVDSSGDAIVGKDLNGIIQTWNTGAEQIFGYSAAEAVGRPITMLIPPERQDEEPGILARIRAGERVDHYETIRRRKDGTLIDISLKVSPIRNALGQVVGASKIARDISARKQAEHRMTLLAREVDHRAKNVLATVVALARMTRATNVADYSKALMGRIHALAEVHSLLSDSRWQGAAVKRLIEQELAAFSSGADHGRLTLSGPLLLLTADAAQGLALAVHELATNAAKYGAWSVQGGRVSVQWETAGEELVFLWSETGGPRAAAPTRKGFGRNLIETAIRTQLDGKVSLDWRTEGLVCEIKLPTAHGVAHH